MASRRIPHGVPVGTRQPNDLVERMQSDDLDAFEEFFNTYKRPVYTTALAEFVDTFSRIGIPAHFPHAFFIEGGALAVDNALKTAFDWKVRKNLAKGLGREAGSKVIHFQQAFHGRSGYTLSLTNTFDPRKTDYFPKFDWPRIVNPKIAFPLTEENLARVVELEEEALQQIRRVMDTEGEDIAAIIIEPIQGEGGYAVPPPNFLDRLRPLAADRPVRRRGGARVPREDAVRGRTPR